MLKHKVSSNLVRCAEPIEFEMSKIASAVFANPKILAITKGDPNSKSSKARSFATQQNLRTYHPLYMVASSFMLY